MIGCSSITFRTLPIEQALEQMYDLGFRVVDIGAVPTWCDHIDVVDPAPGSYARIADRIGKLGIEVSGLQSVPWVPDAIDDEQELSRRYTASADAAVAVGAKVWIVDPGVGRGDDRARGMERSVRTINMAAELARSRSLRLAVELPLKDSLAMSLPESVELLEAVGIPDLGIDLDTGHLLHCGASVDEVLDAFGQRVVHVACRDGVSGGGWTSPGKGEFDFGSFFGLLDAHGYKGDITIELIPESEDLTPVDRSVQALDAKTYLERLRALSRDQMGRPSSGPRNPAR